MKLNVRALPQSVFDEWCQNNNINDTNVVEQKDYAFISIIGTKDVLEHYLDEANTEHWFKENHDNVLNLEFDDVDKDIEFHSHKAYAITEEQAQETVEFIERNLGKNIIVHCRAGQSRSVAVVNYILRAYSDMYETCDNVDYSHPNVDVLAKLSKHLWSYIHEKIN